MDFKMGKKYFKRKTKKSSRSKTYLFVQSVKNEKLNRGTEIALSMLYVISYSNPFRFMKVRAQKHIWTRWVYYYFPFILYFGVIFSMITKEVFWPAKETFNFLTDLSNSLNMPVLFFLSYFAVGHYIEIFEDTISVAVKTKAVKYKFRRIKERMKRKEITILCVFLFFLALSFFSGNAFFNNALTSDSAYWGKRLNGDHRLFIWYYSIFLTLTWYNSLSFLFHVLPASYVLYSSIKRGWIKYDKELYNKNPSIIKIYDLLILNFSYGIFYIGGAVLFVIVDIISNNLYHINNAFSQPGLAIMLFSIVLGLVIFAYIPIHELLSFMRKQKNEYMEMLRKDYLDSSLCLSEKSKIQNDINEIANKGVVLSSLGNKLIVFISLLIPFVGLVLQIIQYIAFKKSK